MTGRDALPDGIGFVEQLTVEDTYYWCDENRQWWIVEGSLATSIADHRLVEVLEALADERALTAERPSEGAS